MAQAELDVFDNPHFALAAYGVTSPYIVWALSQGALNAKRGRGRGPVRSDVLVEDAAARKARRMLRIRLRRRRVLRG